MEDFMTLLEAAETLAGPNASEESVHRWLNLLERSDDELLAARTGEAGGNFLPGGVSYSLAREAWIIPTARFRKWCADHGFECLNLAEAKDRGGAILKREALVSQYERSWPTILRDLSDA